jgi:hypothetical protein
MASDATRVLVIDSATCADVRACDDIACALRLGLVLAVADLVFDRELRGDGERLLRRGLRVESLPDIRPALALRQSHPWLSLGDALTLSLSATNAWTLLTRSPVLERLADGIGVSVTSLARAVANIAGDRTPARVAYPRSNYGLVT